MDHLQKSKYIAFFIMAHLFEVTDHRRDVCTWQYKRLGVLSVSHQPQVEKSLSKDQETSSAVESELKIPWVVYFSIVYVLLST